MKNEHSTSRRLDALRYGIPVFLMLLFERPESLAQTRTTAADPMNVTISFVNVNVASMENAGLLRQQTVLVRGDRIVAVVTVNVVPVPPWSVVIDGSDRYLMPGLADIHVHVRSPFDNAPLFLDAGITTVLSMDTRASDDEARLPGREGSRSPDFLGPTLYMVGTHISGGETPDEAERVVRENVERGFDLIEAYDEV